MISKTPNFDETGELSGCGTCPFDEDEDLCSEWLVKSVRVKCPTRERTTTKLARCGPRGTHTRTRESKMSSKYGNFYSLIMSYSGDLYLEVTYHSGHGWYYQKLQSLEG